MGAHCAGARVLTYNEMMSRGISVKGLVGAGIMKKGLSTYEFSDVHGKIEGGYNAIAKRKTEVSRLAFERE